MKREIYSEFKIVSKLGSNHRGSQKEGKREREELKQSRSRFKFREREREKAQKSERRRTREGESRVKSLARETEREKYTHVSSLKIALIWSDRKGVRECSTRERAKERVREQ